MALYFLGNTRLVTVALVWEGEKEREGEKDTFDLSLDETPPILLWRRIDTYKA